MTKTLVLGASGYIGSHLVPALLAAGFGVRAAARRLDVLEGRQWAGVELAEADAFDSASLDRALEGIDVAYYLIHSMGSKGDFAKRDREAAASFAAACAGAGVGRIIYLGGLQPPGTSSAHLTSRAETGAILRKGGVPVTEIRAGIVVGPGSAAFEVIRDLVNHLPIMITPRWVQSRTQPIALDDLLAYLVGVAQRDAAGDAIYDVKGPETLTYAQLIKQYGEVVGKRRILLPVPVLTPRLSSYWLDLVTAVPTSVVRPLVDGLRHDLVGDDAPIRALMPIPLATYREAVRAALLREREAPLPARWAEGALAFRGFNQSISYHAKEERTVTAAAVPADELWKVVRSIGGKNGYYFLTWLWEIRGAIDRLLGGVGMRRGRRHPTDIRVGDALDFWRVAGVEPGKRLTLVAEMKVPGAASLEFEVEPNGEGHSTLTCAARFSPSGSLGLLYWYALVPVHGVLFRQMPARMVRAAERAAVASSP